MRWAKVVMIALGALIAFIIIESVFRLLEWAVIALVIGLIIAVAVKAHSQYKLARERRAEVKQEKAARKGQPRVEPASPGREITPAPAWSVESTAPAAHGNVDDELARLKREMRS
jgi:type III secretory pathway component EscU